MDIRTAFAVLGLSDSASPREIRNAYRDLVKVWHPDRFTHDAPLQAKAAKMLREINEAYEVVRELRASPVEPPRHAPMPPPEPVIASRPASHFRPQHKVLLCVAVLTGATMGFSVIGRPWDLLPSSLSSFPDLLDPAAATVDLPQATGMRADRSYIDETFTDPLAADSASSVSSRRYASTAGALGSALEGSWLLNGRTLRFRQGAIRLPGHDEAVAYYDPSTPQTLRYWKPRSASHVMVEVVFTPLSMRWYVQDGGRRLIYEFVRVA